MVKVEEIAQAALSAVSCPAGRVLASTWVNDRYKQLIGRVRFKHTRKVGSLEIPTTLTNGIVNIVRGASGVAGDAAALAQWQAHRAELNGQGWFFRGRTVWYSVTDLRAGLLLGLESPFAEDDVINGSYVVAKRHYALPVNVRSIDLFVNMRRRFSFTLVPPEFLDALAPERHDVSTGPAYAAEIGMSDEGGKLLEIYPSSTTSELLHYVYRELPDRLALTDTLPSVIDGYVLKEGVLIDVMRWLQAKAATEGKVEIAALWRNDARAQETKWENAIQAAIMADRGVDDYTLVWQSARFMGQPTHGSPSDILTAHDQAWFGHG